MKQRVNRAKRPLRWRPRPHITWRPAWRPTWHPTWRPRLRLEPERFLEPKRLLDLTLGTALLVLSAPVLATAALTMALSRKRPMELSGERPPDGLFLREYRIGLNEQALHPEFPAHPALPARPALPAAPCRTRRPLAGRSRTPEARLPGGGSALAAARTAGPDRPRADTAALGAAVGRDGAAGPALRGAPLDRPRPGDPRPDPPGTVSRTRTRTRTPRTGTHAPAARRPWTHAPAAPHARAQARVRAPAARSGHPERHRSPGTPLHCDRISG